MKHRFALLLIVAATAIGGAAVAPVAQPAALAPGDRDGIGCEE